jgi:hypothetical protein
LRRGRRAVAIPKRELIETKPGDKRSAIHAASGILTKIKKYGVPATPTKTRTGSR